MVIQMHPLQISKIFAAFFHYFSAEQELKSINSDHVSHEICLELIPRWEQSMQAKNVVSEGPSCFQWDLFQFVATL